MIVSKPSTPEYRANFDRAFSKPKEEKDEIDRADSEAADEKGKASE